ncbi:MAG: hypothetical protein OEO77_10540 [Acidimicrobiia bacterium]|nr:hypothetical protein [Acidimicrobiia bacterium]
MVQHVAVVTPYPALRRGLASVLSGPEFQADQPDDPMAWVAIADNRTLLLAVDHSADMDLVIDLRGVRDDLVIVTLLPDPTLQAVQHALRAGACSVAGWDASAEEIVVLIQAGLAARSVLPTDVARQLATGFVDSDRSGLDGCHIEWLTSLAAGVTVQQLAHKIGYSEREMYRLLRGLYERIGVDNRTQALVWAAQRGILC